MTKVEEACEEESGGDSDGFVDRIKVEWKETARDQRERRSRILEHPSIDDRLYQLVWEAREVVDL